MVDLVSKEWAFAALDALPAGVDRIEVTPFLWLTQHVNKGMVFSLWSGQRFIIIALTSLLIPGIVLVTYQSRADNAPLWALGVLLGGALGNLYDRIFYRHSLYDYGVRDFLDLRNPSTGENLWPVFNVADIAIVAGVLAYIAWSLLWAPEEEDASAGPGANESAPAEETTP